MIYPKISKDLFCRKFDFLNNEFSYFPLKSLVIEINRKSVRAVDFFYNYVPFGSFCDYLVNNAIID